MSPAGSQSTVRDKRRKQRRTALFVLLAAGAASLLLAGCGAFDGDEGIPAFTPAELTALPEDEWITNGGTVYNQRYSPLDQLTPANVSDLKGVWRIQLDSATDAKYSGEAQPLIHDGVAYLSTGASDVFALDVDSGKTIWRYDGNLFDEITTVCCGWTSRGVAIGDGRVYLGKLDGKLVALDASSGKEVWSASVGAWQNGETITSAPLYYDGLVITGLSGGEFGIRGSVTAYDAETGKKAWRFHTIPGPGETGHETWPQDNDAWKHGGAPVWQTPAVDPELGLLYFSTGNTSPDFDGSSRKGDNLFANSIVALDAKTGEYRWHFQQVHHDIWDLDSPSPVVLFDVTIDGDAAARSRRGEQDRLGLHPRPDERQAPRRDRREGGSPGAAPAHLPDAAPSRGRCVHSSVGHTGGGGTAEGGSRRSLRSRPAGRTSSAGRSGTTSTRARSSLHSGGREE